MPKTFIYCPKCAGPLEDEARGGRDRRVCVASGCDFVEWGNPVAVVAAIVEHEGDIIIAHNREWAMRFFGLITGFLEAGETPETGVLREVEEELGLHAERAEFIGHYMFERMNQLIIAYHVVATGEIKLGEELDEIRRVPPERLRPWPGGTGQAVADWLQRRGLA